MNAQAVSLPDTLNRYLSACSRDDVAGLSHDAMIVELVLQRNVTADRTHWLRRHGGGRPSSN